MSTLKYFYRVNIKSFQEYIDLINKFEEKKYYFRGQANPNWNLSSTFKRFYDTRVMNDKPNEKHYIDTFRNSSFKFYENELTYPELEILSIQQHYGGKTRLIDFTEKSDVALFFAISNYEDILKIDNLYSFSIYLISKEMHYDKIPKKLEFEILLLEKKKNMGNSLYVFKPEYSKDETINKRILAQKGLFIFSYNPLDCIEHQLSQSQTWTNLKVIKKMDKSFLNKWKNYLFKINFYITFEELKKIYKYIKKKKIDYSALYPDLNGLCMENNVIFNSME